MTASELPVEELAQKSEDEVREHLQSGKLVEGLAHMSPQYLTGIRRILTVSADTELVSAPAYLRAARHAPALNNFGSAVSIIQDELAHAHIGYRLLGDLGVDMNALIYEREPGAFKYPYAFDVPLDSWHELVLANALYDQAGFVLLSDVHRSSTFGPWKRALAKVDKEETFHLRHGRTWVKKLSADPEDKRRLQSALDWMFILTLEWFGLPGRAQAARHPARVRLQGHGQRRSAPGVDGGGGSVHERSRSRRARALGRGSAALRDRLPVPGPVRRGAQAVAARRRPDLLGRGDGPLEATRADEPRLRRAAPAGLSLAPGGRRSRMTHASSNSGEPGPASGARMSAVEPRGIEARLWTALTEVEDPEIPVSVVGLGLIVSLAYDPAQRAVDLELTFTAMGCPAMEFIQDDIRERLLREPEVDEVRIEVVWDPVWTRSRIREDARARMRSLGIVA